MIDKKKVLQSGKVDIYYPCHGCEAESEVYILVGINVFNWCSKCRKILKKGLKG